MTEERRLVTVLFADVVGSTALGEALDPEDVRALLARFFAIARDAIEQHGGQLEKFIGDAVMAVFGLPVAHDDDPARALAAAIELRDRVRLDPGLGDRLPIRLGVLGGEVIATRDVRDGAKSDFLITGDAVNSAARLQQAADAWGILVGERTARAVGEQFEFGPHLAVEAKGKSVPIAARLLVGAATGGRRPRVRTSLVGRDDDLLQLQLVARRATLERRPYLVNVVAPAGVGKSRLLEEFLDHLSGEPVHVAIAQCLPYGQRLTYWPMRAILLSILELPDDTQPERVREILLAWLEGRGEADPRTAELVAATVGAGDLASADRIALFGAWRRFVELAAEERPLILIIEDLHWSSDSLLDLIESILQPRADVPLMMIALARPELLDRRASWGGGRRNAVSIALEPLPDRAVEELVAGLLQAPDPAIVAAVVQRAEGNPFYAGEIVRSLIDRLGPAPDPAAVPAALAALPDSVQTTVLARLDALEHVTRRVVQLGAVFGRSFHPGSIAALEPSLDDHAVEAAIDGLLDRDLLRSGADGSMTFRHILIREVAYGMLPRAERARLHAAAGSWLETRAATGGREDEMAELIAFHLREATTLGALTGETADPGLTERAVRWLRRASAAAAAGAATVEAARHLEAAIELAPAGIQAELYETLGTVWVGGDQAYDAFDRAHQFGRELGLGPDHALRTLAQRLVVSSRWVGSVSHSHTDDELRAFLAELGARASDATNERALAYGLLAQSFLPGAMRDPHPDDIEAAIDASSRALQIAERLEDTDLQSAALDGLTVGAMAEDRPMEALAFIRHRLSLQGLVTSERLDAMIMLSWMELLLGELAASEAAAAGAREGLASGQAAAWVLGASGWRTEALWALGRWDDALTEAARCELAWRDSQIHVPSFALNGFLAAFAIARARRDPVDEQRWRSVAETIIGRSDPLTRIRRMEAFYHDDLDALADTVVRDHRVFVGRLDYVHRALARLVDCRYPIAEGVLMELLEYCAGRELRFLEAHTRRALGVLLARPEPLREALSAFDSMDARPFAARVRTELGHLEGDRALVDEGLAELERLGDLDQLERAIGAPGPGGSPARSPLS
ncbi:MAG TPA: adenylate/guanylate cyclase domain-containing protein [Patescibacteria group bacterium]|nr:adenylate/guanylate cyclase domain-containing protein [Patescibacteria group bacterium]